MKRAVFFATLWRNCTNGRSAAIGLVLFLPAISGPLAADATAHQFRSVTVAPDQTVTLALDGDASKVFRLTGTVSNQFSQMFDLYPVEASANLLDWSPLALLLRTNKNPNPLLFQDSSATRLNRRFYRTCTNHLLTAFPMPSGPFGVGTVDRVMTDPARTNLYRYSPRTNAFMVTFWYPADQPAAGVLPAAMWDERYGADEEVMPVFTGYGAIGADVQWARVVPQLVGHHFRGVPLASGLARYPVVIYSHGFNATRQWPSQLAGELASHGYIVLAPDHPDCWATEFPDGRYLKGSGSMDVRGRLQDMTFLVDELARLDQRDTLFVGRLDLDHIGVCGQSAGGMVVETCRGDRRVHCAAIWDSTNLQLNSAGLKKPFLAAVGENGLFYSENQWLFNKATTNAVLLQIKGADHLSATDLGWTWEIPWGRAPALAYSACLVWFFDTYLRGRTPAFPANPIIYNLRRK